MHRSNHQLSEELDEANDERRQALRPSLCMHRYFAGTPQRMGLCGLPSGHSGECGQPTKEGKS